MSPKDVVRVLDNPIAQELLVTTGLMRLAYTGRDGYPRVIPTGFIWDGSALTVCTAEHAPKFEALRRDPRTAWRRSTSTPTAR